jgi:hypothetical protein
MRIDDPFFGGLRAKAADLPSKGDPLRIGYPQTETFNRILVGRTGQVALASAGVFDRPRLPNNRDLDLARVFELLLDLPGDLV